jgi:sec-independent protein translocase protein TatC
MTDKTPPEEESKLGSFVTHLVELRDRLLRMVIAVGVVFLVLAPFAKDIYAIFAKPLTDTLPDGVNMLIIGVAAPLLVPYKLTLMVAFLVALPYVFYQMWQFVAPGLYKHEKRLVFPLLSSSVGLFYLGVAFAYFVLLPMMFIVLPMFTPENTTYSPDIGSYFDFVMMMFIAFGFSFEMPIATILLISTGTTTAESLAKKRPYVIVGAFVVGMILTPPDVISQILLAVPMWLLFEAGLLLSQFFNQRVKEAGTAIEERKQAEREASDAAAAGTDSSNNTVASIGGAAAAATVADQANALWSDSDSSSDQTDSDLEDDTGYMDADTAKAYQDFEDYHPLSDDELDAELEAIDDDERTKSDARADSPSDQTDRSEPPTTDSDSDNKH